MLQEKSMKSFSYKSIWVLFLHVYSFHLHLSVYLAHQCQGSSFYAQGHTPTEATTFIWKRYNSKQITKPSPNVSFVSLLYCLLVSTLNGSWKKSIMLAGSDEVLPGLKKCSLPFSNLGSKWGDSHPNSQPICQGRGESYGYIIMITL